MDYNPLLENRRIFKDVSTQLSNLGLSEKEIKGRILDVGARNAEFSRYFRRKEKTEVSSIDSKVERKNKPWVIEADVMNIPFPDNSFDLVISHASVPNIFLDFNKTEKELESEIMKSFLEIIRVLKKQGKAYLAPVSMADNYKPQKLLKDAILKSIENLKEMNIKTELTFLRTDVNPKNNEKSDSYRLIIEKST